MSAVNATGIAIIGSGARWAAHLLAASLCLLAPQVAADEDSVARGRYLSGVLGCAGCHTRGTMLGTELGPDLAGSDVGLAYGPEVDSAMPAVVFPGNLTPDLKTGLGGWSRAEIVAALKHGVGRHGEPLISVMPWTNYSRLSDDDAGAIADYLQSLPARHNQVPAAVPAGETSRHSYVRIGVYVFYPDGTH